MSAFGFDVFVFVAFFVEVMAQTSVLFVEKVSFADGDVVERGFGGKEIGKLVLRFGVLLEFSVSVVALAVYVNCRREKTYVAKSLAEEIIKMLVYEVMSRFT